MATQEQISALKTSWRKDPCWDIEDTEGFEDHKDELLAYRLEVEEEVNKKVAQQLKDRLEVIKDALGVIQPDAAMALHTFSEIEFEVKRQDRYIAEGPSSFEMAKVEIAQAQVRATLLLAAQLQRFNDSLDEITAGDGLMVSAVTVDKYQL